MNDQERTPEEIGEEIASRTYLHSTAPVAVERLAKNIAAAIRAERTVKDFLIVERDNIKTTCGRVVNQLNHIAEIIGLSEFSSDPVNVAVERLVKERDELKAAVRKAASVFVDYAALHWAKGTTESVVKGNANQQLSDEMFEALKGPNQ